jgi:hypothetical protein
MILPVGKGNDENYGDTYEGVGMGDDLLTGNGRADKFQCGSGTDEVTDFNQEGGDKATGNCENIDKGNKYKK